MNKTIYIRDADVEVWDKAKELAGDKLSPIIIEGLRSYVVEQEALVKGFDRIVVEFKDADDNGLKKKKAFYGRYIYGPSNKLDLTDDEEETTDTYTVAETVKGAFVITKSTYYHRHADGSFTTFRVYSSLSVAASDPSVRDAARLAVEKRGVPVEELDI